MKKLIIFFALVCNINVITHAQDAQELHETARTFMKQGDFVNATLVLTRALKHLLRPDCARGQHGKTAFSVF